MSVVISGTGLFTPKEYITNDELVESFNAYVDYYNQENEEAINTGELEPLTHSSTEFIKKASGIERRYVLDKKGILDISRMKPKLQARDNSDLSIQAEMAVEASKAALKISGLDSSQIDGVILWMCKFTKSLPLSSYRDSK